VSIFKIFILCLFCSLTFAETTANPTLIITKIRPTSLNSTSLKLPHFVSQTHSGLLHKEWILELPADTIKFEIPTVFISQSIAGAVFSIKGETLYEIARSDESTLRNNYTPALIPIPKSLLSTNGITQLRIAQTGHLRGWFIPPILLGELRQLQPLNNTYTYFGQTLSTTINIVCSFAGLFLVFIGVRTQEKTYLYGGAVTIIWSLLFSLALISELPTNLWYCWRLFLYLIVGYLINFVCLFLTEIFEQETSGHQIKIRLIISNLGWLIFGVGGSATEKFLDVYWVALVVALYILHSVLVIRRAFKNRLYKKAVPIGLHLVLTSLFATHDYLLQAGLLKVATPTTQIDFFQSFIYQPIYLTHLALPAFTVMAFTILYKDHLYKTKQQKIQAQQYQQQRERLVNDIHDGVGSRINLLLWQLKLSPPSHHQIEEELRRCMDQLRFAINPIDSGHITLEKSLSSLCYRLQTQCESIGVQILYAQTAEIQPISTSTALQLFNIIQEGLTNALRHSQATQIKLELDQTDESLKISIEDNGIGIKNWNNSNQQQSPADSTSLGIRSIFNRVKNIPSSKLHIASDACGTKILVELCNSVTNISSSTKLSKA
jgi:signal transduction histidine kinase